MHGPIPQPTSVSTLPHYGSKTTTCGLHVWPVQHPVYIPVANVLATLGWQELGAETGHAVDATNMQATLHTVSTGKDGAHAADTRYDRILFQCVAQRLRVPCLVGCWGAGMLGCAPPQ